MTTAPSTACVGRPLPGALAVGGALGAFVALVWPENVNPSEPPVLALACALAAVWLFSLVLGAVPRRRAATATDPAAIMNRLARNLGLIGLTIPLALFAIRGVQAVPLSSVGRVWLAVLVCCPTGWLFGRALTAVREAARDHPRWRHRPVPLPLLLAGAILAGAVLVWDGAGSRLAPLTLALDLTVGCAVIGLVCIVGLRGASRRLERWLSVLALLAVLCLPVSGVLDGMSRQWRFVPLPPPSYSVEAVLPRGNPLP